MKKTLLNVSSILALVSLPASAATYPGTGNANGTGFDGPHMTSAVINNTASTITFTINSSDTMASWIFYAIEIQKIGGPVGDTGFVNPWGPQIGISSGMNALINTWGTGATPFIYSGSWVAGSGASYDAGGAGFNYATMTFALSDLGLSLGDSFYFDVIASYTSPGGQSAYGALDNTSWPAESDNLYTPWNGTSHYDSATDAGGTIFGTEATKYTVVPEPAICVLMGMGALVFIRRFRRTA